MKKLVFVIALIVVTLAAQSCCVRATCPGVAQVEVPQSDS